MIIKTVIRILSLGLITAQTTMLPMRPVHPESNKTYTPQPDYLYAHSRNQAQQRTSASSNPQTFVGDQYSAPHSFHSISRQLPHCSQQCLSAPPTPRSPFAPRSPYSYAQRSRSTTPTHTKPGPVTSISWAAGHGRFAETDSLLRSGKNPNVQDGNGKTALSWAAGAGKSNKGNASKIQTHIFEQIIDLLLHNPYCPVKKENPEHTLYNPAHPECTCANPDIQDGQGKTALHWAAGNPKCLEIVNLLLAAGADPLLPNYHGQTPLYWAQLSGGATIENVIQQVIGNSQTAAQAPLALPQELPEAIAKKITPLTTENLLERQLAGFAALLACLKDYDKPLDPFEKLMATLDPK